MKVQTVPDSHFPSVAAVDSSADPAGRPPVFTATALCKTYQMGDVAVHALRDVELTIYRGDRKASCRERVLRLV